MAWMVNRKNNNSGSGSVLLLGPTVFRSDSSSMDHQKIERRQLFLRSYQFSRKKSLKEKIKRSFMRVKRVIWFRFRCARRFRKLVWSKLSKIRYSNGYYGGFHSRKSKSSRFLRLLSSSNNYKHRHHGCDDKGSSCFW